MSETFSKPRFNIFSGTDHAKVMREYEDFIRKYPPNWCYSSKNLTITPVPQTNIYGDNAQPRIIKDDALVVYTIEYRWCADPNSPKEIYANLS